MKISESEKREILSKYNILEQRGSVNKVQNQNTNSGKRMYRRLPAVNEIQTKLKQLSTEIGNPNLDPGNIDGIFGDKTLKAFNVLVSIYNNIPK